MVVGGILKFTITIMIIAYGMSIKLTQEVNMDRTNTTGQIFAPPLYTTNDLPERMSIIPFNFWTGMNRTDSAKNFLVLRTKNNNALTCSMTGDVSLGPITPDSQRFDHLWIPEFIGENILRLRSYNGGYLQFDLTRNTFTCDKRAKNIFNIWMVFLSRTGGACLLLEGLDMRFISLKNNRLGFENITSNELTSFCFQGDKSIKFDLKRHYFDYGVNINELTVSRGGVEAASGFNRTMIPGRNITVHVETNRTGFPLGPEGMFNSTAGI